MKKILPLLFFLISTSIFQAQEQDNQWGFINTLPDYQLGSHLGAISAVNDTVVYLTAKHGIFYKTTNGGDSWTTTDSGTGEDFVDLAFYNVHIGFAVGVHGTILKTSNSGQNWTPVSSVTTHNLAAISINGLNDIWVVGGAGTILHSTDIGETWQINSEETTEQLNSVAFKNNQIGYIAGNNGTLLKTTDAGQTWNAVELNFENENSNDLFSLNIKGNSIRMLQGQVEVYEGQYFDISYHGQSILSTSAGNNWNSASTFNTTGAGSSGMAFKSQTDGYLIEGGAALCDCCFAIIKKTTDGETWEQSFQAESTADPCLFNWGFADFSLTANSGYAFQGNHVLKLNGGDPYWLNVNKLTKDNFQLYPNPATEQITLDFKNTGPGGLSVEIFSLHGKQVFLKKHLEKENTLPLENLNPGVYFLKLTRHGKAVATKKFIKQ